MAFRLGQTARFGLMMAFVLLAAALAPISARSAPYAAMVMDARTGEILHSRNAETRLHPASLTKMMTLYVAFQAVSRGEITLDTEVRITADAANEPPSRLGLQAGQTIRLRYLLRAAAVKSANDAATAIGIAISGSEEAFARRMNATAVAMGMTNTNFVVMHGLTTQGHYSTAQDMTILGRHVIYDFPQYYNLFSRRSADAGVREVYNTNRRFLDAYEGADGIKTGFTNAAGFNLTASAVRGDVRIIATMFGGTSTAQRNARVAELLDMGFARANENVVARAPDAPAYSAEIVGDAAPADGAGRTVRVTGQVLVALRPIARPGTAGETMLVAAATESVDDALMQALGMVEETPPEPEPVRSALAPDEVTLTPSARPTEIIMTAEAIVPAEDAPTAEPEVVTRISTSGGRLWGINVGRFPTRNAAERAMIQIAISESSTLEGSLRRVLQRSGAFDANFMGLTREGADIACRRLQARGTQCFMIGDA